MKKPLLTYRIVFLCISLLLAAAGLLQAQTPCRKFVQVPSGDDFESFAVAEDGTLWVCRRRPTWAGSTEVTQVGTDRDWERVAAGLGHRLAIKTNGTLWAWGSNYSGQLGLGHTIKQPTPVQVSIDADWDSLMIRGGGGDPSLSMALKTNGSLWFWGNDGYYQSGLSDDPPYNIPHVQSRLSPIEVGTRARDWKVVSVGYSHVVAVKTNGTLWAWGRNSDYGEIGHGAPTYPNLVKAPFQLGTATDWKTVAAGYGFNLAIKNDGTLWSWGSDAFGKLGNGSMSGTSVHVTTQVGTDRDWKAIAAGGTAAYALKNDGSLWAWGGARGALYGLGYDGTRRSTFTPARLGESNDWVSISARGSSLMGGLKSDGSLWTFESDFRLPARVIPDVGVGLALHGDAETLPATDQWHYFQKDCRLICEVQQTNHWGHGLRFSGNSLTARVWIDRRIGYSVKRHYQITPAFDAATTTGRVRLYFTQEEFDEFNRTAASSPTRMRIKKLPTGPDDIEGIANLRIEQYSGVSADGSGDPASYPGAAQIFDPDDLTRNPIPDDYSLNGSIVWNAAHHRWEITFHVTGFGGFWVKTTEDPPSVIFGSIAARLQGGSLWVDFTSEKETNNHHYEIEASTDGKTFKKIGELRSQTPNGNSDTPLSYTFKTSVSGIMGAAGIGGAILLALAAGIGGTDPRKRLLYAAIVAITLLGAAACAKKSRESVAQHHHQKIWVRIAPVDKDAIKEYSIAVQAVAED